MVFEIFGEKLPVCLLPTPLVSGLPTFIYGVRCEVSSSLIVCLLFSQHMIKVNLVRCDLFLTAFHPLLW